MLARAVGVAALVVLSVYVVRESIGRTTHGFVAYYGAARLFASGELDARVYDDQAFEQYVQGLTASGVREIFGPNTPAMALLAVPVTPLSPLPARTVWLACSLAVLATAAAWLARSAAHVDARRMALLVALMLLNPSVFANLRTGQAYIIIFGAFTAVALFIVRGRDVAAGVVLGALLIVKSTGWPILLLLALHRRLRAVTTAVAVAGGVALLVAATSGLDVWRRYPLYVQEFLARPTTSVTAYQTTRSLVRRLCIADPMWNPRPAGECQAAAGWIPSLLIGSAIVVTMVVSRRASVELSVAAGVVLSILVAPVGEEEHYVSLAVPLVLLLAHGTHGLTPHGPHGLTPHGPHGLTPHGTHGLTPLLSAVVAILWLIPLDYTALRFTEGWSALLGYPRLYAGWAVWALVVREMLPKVAAIDNTV